VNPAKLTEYKPNTNQIQTEYKYSKQWNYTKFQNSNKFQNSDTTRDLVQRIPELTFYPIKTYPQIETGTEKTFNFPVRGKLKVIFEGVGASAFR